MTLYESRDGRLRLFRGDSRRLHPIVSGSVGVILTSPPYWVRGRGRQAAERYARDLAVGFGREWKRVLAPDGDLWLMIGDRHDGAEWVGMDALVTGWLRRTGWRLQSRGFWLQTRSRERWDNRVNYLLRFRKAGQAVRPRGTTLGWMLPLPRSHPDSLWDAIPEPLVRAVLEFRYQGINARRAELLRQARERGLSGDPREAVWIIVRPLVESINAGEMFVPFLARVSANYATSVKRG